MTPDAATPEERLALWVAADAEIGLAAERDELRRRLAQREREVADLRERLAHLNDLVGQLRARPVAPAPSGSLGRRAYREVRRTIGALRRR